MSEYVYQRRIVCAAIWVNDHVICGPRHYDPTMIAQLKVLDAAGECYSAANVVQGFVDQHGVFLTREEALPIALAAGQRIRRCGNDEDKLWSENLY